MYAYNYDRTLWKYTGGTYPWQYVDKWSSIKLLAGNFEGLFGIEDNGMVWNKTWSWYRVGKAGVPVSFAGGYEIDPTTGTKVGRPFKLINHDLYMSTANGRDNHWQYIDRPYYAKEIAAGSSRVRWALNTDSKLYLGTINE